MQTQVPAMLSGEMPEKADFKRQVELNRIFEGTYPLEKFSRLSEYLVSDNGDVIARIEFGRSVGFAFVRAKVSAKLQVKCQRCLQALDTEVSGSFKFALVRSEDEFELLPEEFEPHLLEGEEQSIIDLIEDELILCLPMVTVHENECSDYMTGKNNKVKAVMKDEKESSHPFAALKLLKDDFNKAN